MRRLRFLLALLVAIIAVGAAAGRMLVVNDPQHADAILVLAGETQFRPVRALELFDQGYGSKIILDVPAREHVFIWSSTDLAQRWIQTLPQTKEISICPIYALSTADEAIEAEHCAKQLGARSILLVTSDFHTRRALSTFQHQVPGITFSIAAASDSTTFGMAWWKHREWAKTTFYESLRLLWWEVVDRWR